PYSSSKACSELITLSYLNSFFHHESINKKLSNVRSGNIIGGGDWQENRLIPDCMRAIMYERKINIRSPEAIRPWQFVLEPIRGYLNLVIEMSENGTEFSGAWNFGPDESFIYKVREVVERIFECMKANKDLIKYGNPQISFHETHRLLLDCSKVRRKIDWKPILNIDEIIEMTCDWYQNHEVNYDYNVKQINNYMEKLKSIN
ncbi:MAG: CDP-glucose 4,6-dehydratase, partial [Candidatus Lokiarchaeota archaeon]|nr:CDP-glucose 4,6-dehydratase [Candidatus Lokiarchaeota archaeon]